MFDESRIGIMTHNTSYSDDWEFMDWKKFQKILFRLQKRIFKGETLNKNTKTWQHQGLREIPIPKKNGSKRLLKVPTIADRAWQCLVKYALEPAHEATFHARSYGFRPGRSTHDAQKKLFHNLRSSSKGINKRILELDIEKCFDRINHNAILDRIIAPDFIKIGLERRNYHKYCKLDGSRFSLWNLNHRAFKVFLKQKTINRYQAEKMVKIAFPSISFSENKFINVKGEKSPYDGDISYWSKRNSTL
jgi:hypothetical protein